MAAYFRIENVIEILCQKDFVRLEILMKIAMINISKQGGIEMLRVAFIGFGNSVCRYHLPYVERRDYIEVKYIYRRAEDRLGDEERESWYPHIKFTTDLDEVMNDKDVDLIVVNSPNDTHVPYTMMALEHGKHVLCEKPFAMTSEEAKKVFDFAKSKGLIAMANQNRRFDADMKTVKKVIDSGVLGDVVEFESHYDYFRPGYDHEGFGLLYGLGVHPIDQVIYMFGKAKRYAYDCRSVCHIGKSDDYYDIDFFYGKSKAIVKTSMLVKLDYPRFIVHGTKGSFLMPPLGHQSAQAKKAGPVEISFDPLPEKFWGTLSYIDDEGKDITMKVPVEVGDYGAIYDNIHDMMTLGMDKVEKVVKDEEVIEVLKIIEEATKVAKAAKE